MDKTELAMVAMKETTTMVTSYAKRLLNDERASQFAATMALMAKSQPKILQCSPQSILSSMMACVHLDLMPNTPEQLAFIIPYQTKVGMVAQFQIGYKGMVKLAYRSGDIKNISAEIVFPEDTFEWSLGSDRSLKHIPSLKVDRSDFTKAIAVYATAKLANGETVFDVMTKEELEKVKNTSKAKSTDSPWQTWGESMAKKTAVKRLLKFLPSSTVLAAAAQYDSWAEAGKLREKDGQIVVAEGAQIAGLDIPPPEKSEAPKAPELSSELENKLDQALESVQETPEEDTQTEPEPTPSKPWEDDPRFNPNLKKEEAK